MTATVPTPIDPLGTPPTTQDPTSFDARGDALFGQLPTTVNQMNALGTNVYGNAVDAANSATAADAAKTAAQQARDAAAASAASAINAPGSLATGVSTVSISLGAKAITLAQTGKAFGLGQWAQLTDLAAPTLNWMVGAITAFNPATGDMTLQVVQCAGSGNVNSWSLSLCPPIDWLGLQIARQQSMLAFLGT